MIELPPELNRHLEHGVVYSVRAWTREVTDEVRRVTGSAEVEGPVLMLSVYKAMTDQTGTLVLGAARVISLPFAFDGDEVMVFDRGSLPERFQGLNLDLGPDDTFVLIDGTSPVHRARAGGDVDLDEFWVVCETLSYHESR